jgi:hypothetical protein
LSLKKTVTIILLGILLFNWCGYQLLTACMENRVLEQFQSKLDDNQYDESELVSIRVPAENLSYYNHSNKFERVYGQIEIGGVLYSYVKRRLYNDSIEMLCIPNCLAARIKKISNDFFSRVNDLQLPGQDQNTGSQVNKNFSGDYCTVHALFRINDLFFSTQKPDFYYSALLPSNPSFTDEHPPEIIA